MYYYLYELDKSTQKGVVTAKVIFPAFTNKRVLELTAHHHFSYLGNTKRPIRVEKYVRQELAELMRLSGALKVCIPRPLYGSGKVPRGAVGVSIKACFMVDILNTLIKRKYTASKLIRRITVEGAGAEDVEEVNKLYRFDVTNTDASFLMLLCDILHIDVLP